MLYSLIHEVIRGECISTKREHEKIIMIKMRGEEKAKGEND